MRWRHWTPREDRTLRRLAPTRTAKQIARVLDRTPHAVHQRAYLLKVGLQKAGNRNPRTKWPDELVERIRAMHEAGVGPTAIASETGVPIGNVKAFVYYVNRASASLVLLHEKVATQ